MFTYVTQPTASSPLLPTNDIFVIAAAVRLFPSITVSLPPTAEPSPVTADLIAQRPSERRPSDSNKPEGMSNGRRRQAERIKIEQKGSSNLAQVVCDCSHSQLLQLMNNNTAQAKTEHHGCHHFLWDKTDVTKGNPVLLYHKSIFQIKNWRVAFASVLGLMVLVLSWFFFFWFFYVLFI